MGEWTVQDTVYTILHLYGEEHQKDPLHKRETEQKSTNLEKAGFVKGMREVKDNGLIIIEVVTGAHL